MLFNRSMNKKLHGDELIIIFFSIIQDIIKTAGSFQRGFTPLPTLALSKQDNQISQWSKQTFHQ